MCEPHGMEFAQTKFVVEPALLDGDAVAMSPDAADEMRRRMSLTMDLMIAAAIGGEPLPPPPEPAAFVWPPKPKRFALYGIATIRDIA